ncbi:MAG: hypothetical protein M1820_000797 [Bogoriella megaspora]|nr:MAG: hypothetical protein M1820_000797 [Bogoriella megaspora]
MTSTNLLDGTSPYLKLTHPSDDEKVAQWKKNGVFWKGALTIEAYLKRERYLLEVPLARDGGLTHWILVDPSGSGSRKVLAGCETLKKKALVAHNGLVEDVVCHGVGSVFSPTEFRSRGYGVRLMQEVGSRLRTWQTNGTHCAFSVLFSDIGKLFYAKSGWHPFPSAHISIPAITGDLAGSNFSPQAKELFAGDLAELCAIDEQLIRAELNPYALKPIVAILPDISTIQWHHAREEFVGKELLGSVPKVKGAIFGEEGKRVWCYWTRMWYNDDPLQRKGNTLHVLRIAAENVSAQSTEDLAVALAAVLRIAQHEAKSWRMEQVQIWNPAPFAIVAAKTLDPHAEIIHRETESITCLRWYGDGSDSDSTIPATDQCDWIANEKYGWC